MDYNMITYLACICFIFIFGRIFIMPIKKILKLILNSIIGGITIYLINLVGGAFGFHIGLNFFTSIIIRLIRITRSSVLSHSKTLSVLICHWGRTFLAEICQEGPSPLAREHYSTVTDFAKFLGLSTSKPFSFEVK